MTLLWKVNSACFLRTKFPQKPKREEKKCQDSYDIYGWWTGKAVHSLKVEHFDARPCSQCIQVLAKLYQKPNSADKSAACVCDGGGQILLAVLRSTSKTLQLSKLKLVPPVAFIKTCSRPVPARRRQSKYLVQKKKLQAVIKSSINLVLLWAPPFSGGLSQWSASFWPCPLHPLLSHQLT